MSNSFFEVEHSEDGGIVFRFKPALMRFSEPTREHLLGAKRELLLALRSMLDTAIEGTEECQRRTVSRTRRDIKVE